MSDHQRDHGTETPVPFGAASCRVPRATYSECRTMPRGIQSHNAGVAGSSPAPATPKGRGERVASHEVTAFLRDLFALPLLNSATTSATTGPRIRQRVLDRTGYVRVVGIPGGSDYEHRLVAAAMIGRRLRPGEVVHHVNENRADNRPENLVVLRKGQHSTHHNRARPCARSASGRFLSGGAR